MKKTKGFTLIEIVVAAVIISVLAAMAVTGHQKLLLREREKRVLMNLRTLSAATTMFKSKRGTAYLGPGSGSFSLAELNTALGTDIKDDSRISYEYIYYAPTDLSRPDSFDYRGNVQDMGGTALFSIQMGEGVEPYCQSGTCPTTPTS